MPYRVGILGGGQLALMMAEAASCCDVEVTVYAPEINPLVEASFQNIKADFDDLSQLIPFVESHDVVTIESENIPEATLALVDEQQKLYPPLPAIHVTKDRLKEKTLFNTLGIHTNRYLTIDSEKDALTIEAELGFPCIIKQRREGYDGKGQALIKDKDALQQFIKDNALSDLIAEAFVPFEKEVSIVAARRASGDIYHFPLCENKHREGILRQTMPIEDDVLMVQAKEAIDKILSHFDYVGVLTLELFVHNNQLVANELAPRVHNSGHWTIEGTEHSQFENHLRAISGQTLGVNAHFKPSVMLNFIGSVPDGLSQSANCFIHDYQKAPRKNRKLGHATFVADSAEQLSILIDKHFSQ